MDYLSKDIVYECIGYLHWKEYYDVCELFCIPLEIKRYSYQHTWYMTDPYDMCDGKREYVEVLRYLYENEYESIKTCINACIYLLVSRGYLTSLKIFEKEITISIMHHTIAYGHTNIIQYLHKDLDIPLPMKLKNDTLSVLIAYGYVDMFIYLHNNGVVYDKKYLVDYVNRMKRYEFLGSIQN